jgi:hypothetical protein
MARRVSSIGAVFAIAWLGFAATARAQDDARERALTE